MKKLEGNKLAALLIAAGMATTFLAACSINTDELGQGLNDLSNAFTGQTVKETEKEKETTESSETEITTAPTTEEVIETSPTPTPSPTPSPTPLPQRVDFSEYTDIDLTDNFKVTIEEFGESSHSDDDEFVFATFEGTRMVVTSAVNTNVRDSINIITDGFYSEAEGAYKRVAAKAEADYKLTGVVEAPYAVTVDFLSTTNGRALSVLMVYEVKGVEADETTVIDFASFDMLSGQYITLPAVSVDPAGLEAALKLGLENSLKVQPTPSVTAAPANTQANVASAEETEARRIPAENEIEAIYIAPGPATADSQTSSFATIYGIAGDEVYSAVIDINAYADFLNRYGISIFVV